MPENEKSEEQVWLSVRETAKRLGTTEEMVRRKIRAFELPAQRLTDAPRAPWMVNAAALERRLEVEARKRRFHESGVVVGFSDEGGPADQEFVAEIGQRHGPETAAAVGDVMSRRRLFADLEREMREDPAVRQRLETLEEEDRIEAAAQELARRVREHERIQRRAEEILDEEDE